MQKSFGKRDDGMMDPVETIEANIPNGVEENRNLKTVFFALAGIGVALFAFNFYKDSQKSADAPMLATAPATAPTTTIFQDFSEIDRYLAPDGDSSVQIKIKKYERTLATLETCGSDFSQVKAGYSSANGPSYQQFKTQQAAPAQTNAQSGVGDMQFNVALRRDSSQVSQFKNAQAFNQVGQKQGDTVRNWTTDECQYVADRAAAGKLNI